MKIIYLKPVSPISNIAREKLEQEYRLRKKRLQKLVDEFRTKNL